MQFFYAMCENHTWMRLKAWCTYDTDISYLTKVFLKRKKPSVTIDVHKASLFAQNRRLSDGSNMLF